VQGQCSPHALKERPRATQSGVVLLSAVGKSMSILKAYSYCHAVRCGIGSAKTQAVRSCRLGTEHGSMQGTRRRLAAPQPRNLQLELELPRRADSFRRITPSHLLLLHVFLVLVILRASAPVQRSRPIFAVSLIDAMRSLSVTVAALLASVAGASTLQPPVLPLIVRNPYLSTWLQNAREEPWTKWPMFWTGAEVGSADD
jgi:hypothetical protein